MRRQRNNIQRMPWEHRRIVCRLLFEGATYEEIRGALVAAGELRVAHDSSILAYGKSGECREYIEKATGYRSDLERDRAIAATLNDGRGPESQADLIVMDVLRSLRNMTAGGAIDNPRDLAAVTRALKPILDRETDELKAAHGKQLDALKAAHKAEVVELHARIAELKGMLDEAVNGGGSVDPSVVADQLDEALGRRKKP